MLVNLTRLELEKTKQKLNHCLYLASKNTVIKDCHNSNNCPSLVNERIDFISQLPRIEGMTYPINVYSEYGYTYGYEMSYLKDFVNIGDYIYNKKRIFLPLEIKKQILLKILTCLKELNKEYVVSDINNSNIMFNMIGQSALIDWENGAPINSGFHLLCKCELIDVKNLLQADSFKLFTCALSLIYEYDFEGILMYVPIQRFINMIQSLSVDQSIKSFLNDFAFELNIGSNRIVYFDEYLEYFKDLKNNSIKKVQRQITEEYYNDTLSLLK